MSEMGKFSLQGAWVQVPPPPPPPPQIIPTTVQFESNSTQTEMLSGDIDAMSDRLLVYGNRIKSLDTQIISSRREALELRKTLSQLSMKKSKEIMQHESVILDLKRENNRLNESVEMTKAKLTESNKLIEYYKNFCD
jgi:chromosome segregation ATPase